MTHDTTADAVERGVKAIQDVREFYRDRPHPASMEEWDKTIVQAVIAAIPTSPVAVTEATVKTGAKAIRDALLADEMSEGVVMTYSSDLAARACLTAALGVQEESPEI